MLIDVEAGATAATPVLRTTTSVRIGLGYPSAVVRDGCVSVAARDGGSDRTDAQAAGDFRALTRD